MIENTCGETENPKGGYSDDTANHLLIQDRNDEGETHGPRGSGVDGRIQSWDWAERVDGSDLPSTWAQLGYLILRRLWIAVVLMLQGGGRCLEDLRELRDEEGLMKLIGRDEIPEPDTVGDWLRRMGESERGEAMD